MTLMYVQEDETLRVRGMDTCIYHGVGTPTLRNADIDVRERVNSAPQRVQALIGVILSLGLLISFLNLSRRLLSHQILEILT